MENKYTKGEWKIDQNGAMPKLRIRDVNNRIICDCFSFSEAIQKDEAEANAKLIAAAPDLLEALVSLRKWAISKGISIDGKLIINADNAINKAHGK